MAKVCHSCGKGPAFGNSRGLRLTAVDADWTHGERGPIVRGPAADLVSVLGSRPAMLARLDGDGVDLLASRVSRHLIRTAGSVTRIRCIPEEGDDD